MTPEEFNESCIRELRALDLSSYVVVVGSGPSSPYIAPSSQLQNNLCSRCGITRSGTEPFWQLAERAYNNNELEYHGVIQESYGATPYWQSKTYTHIAGIPFKGFVTLNYDDQLPSACRDVLQGDFEHCFTVYPPRDGQTFASAIDFIGQYRQVLCAHGYADPANPDWQKQIILKASDYDTHYTDQTTNHLFHFWKTLLLLNPCLFVGMSLEEPGLSKVMEDLMKNHEPKFRSMGHRHLIRSSPIPGTGDYPLPARSLGAIEQLQFDPVDGRYSGLIRVLGALSGLPTESPSPKAPAPVSISATNSFLFSP